MNRAAADAGIPPLLPQALSDAPPCHSSRTRGRLAQVLLASGLIAGAAFAAHLALVSGFAWRCPVMMLCHIPCPSCGSTRALAALSQGQVLDAWRFNPLLITSIPVAVFAYVGWNRVAGRVRGLWAPFLIAVVLNWFYLLLFLPR